MPLEKRTWKSTLVGVCEAALWITAIASLATALNEWHRLLELFSHFRLQYFAASLLFLVVFLVLKWRFYIWLGAATLALNAWLVVPWFIPVTDIEPSPSDVRLLHANVLISNRSSDALLALIDEEDPDLIVLQEVNQSWLASMRSIHPSYPYRVLEPRDDAFGIALFSKFPLEASTVIEAPPLGHPDIVATAMVGGKRLNIISSHPIPPMGVTDYGARNLQMDSAAQIAARTPHPVIAVGDFNITMWAAHHKRFEEVSGLVNARKGFGIEPTWPLFLPIALIPIDHCFVSEDIVVTNFETGPRIGSDHLPILVSLSLASTRGEDG